MGILKNHMKEKSWSGNSTVLLFGGGLLIVWMILSVTKQMPTPLETVVTFYEDIFKIMGSIYNSLKTIGLSFIMAFIMVFILIVLSLRERWNQMIEWMMTILHPIPGVALLPLILMIFGLGWQVKVIVVIHSILWPLLINIKSEITRVDHLLGEMLTLYQMKKRRLYRLYFLGSVPGIISGSKIAFSRAWRAVISTEMIFSVVGTDRGIGFYIFEKRVWGDAAGVVAGIIGIVVVSLVIEKYLFDLIEKKTTEKWL